MILFLTAFLTSVHACPDDPEGALRDALSTGDAAWNALDGDALDASHRAMSGALACSDAPLTTEQSAAVHLAQARYAWTTFDVDASTRAWLAFRDLSPEWTEALDADVPVDHPVRTLWGAREPWFRSVDEAPPGGWLIDGEATERFPMDRAFVVQAVGKDGEVAYTAWHTSIADLPQNAWRAERVRRLRRRGTVVAVGGALVGGVLLGVAVDAGSKATDPNTPLPEVSGHATRANVAGAAGGTLLAASAVSVGVLWGVRW